MTTPLEQEALRAQQKPLVDACVENARQIRKDCRAERFFTNTYASIRLQDVARDIGKRGFPPEALEIAAVAFEITREDPTEAESAMQVFREVAQQLVEARDPNDLRGRERAYTNDRILQLVFPYMLHMPLAAAPETEMKPIACLWREMVDFLCSHRGRDAAEKQVQEMLKRLQPRKPLPENLRVFHKSLTDIVTGKNFRPSTPGVVA